MSELKLPRLLAAAKEFNIGQDTLVEFLVEKGFSRDELKPSAKLTERMYYALTQGFQSDKVAKSKADEIEIFKGAQEKKRLEEAAAVTMEASVAKEARKKEKAAKEPKPKAVQEETVVEEKPVTPIVEEVQIQEAIEVKPVVAEEEPAPQPKVIKAEAPEIEAPKVLDKIDLSAIDSSTRPKKGAVKKEEPVIAKKAEPEVKEEVKKEEVKPVIEKPIVEEKPVPAVIETPQPPKVEAVQPVAPPAPVVVPPVETPAADVPAVRVIENIRAQKLEGPKILGKIELPVDSDTRPKVNRGDEKRKRKRIPVDKRGTDIVDKPKRTTPFGQPGGGGGGQQQQGGGHRPPYQGQGQGGGNRNAGGGGARPKSITYQVKEDREINQKEIQEKIRQTQAKLSGSGGGRGRNIKTMKRRARREEMEEAAADAMRQGSKLQVTEFVTVSELANLMDVSFAEVISKCMNLGIMVSINQRLDAEVIELVSSEFGFEVEFIGLDDTEDEAEEIQEDPENLQPRPPIVTIMGHVDHGKTSLLDYIRDANVVAGEAGGITQHIGAYQVTTKDGKKLTFLDTPGHEAFTAMRARGAKAADVAIIVVAADDAVMPQTREAISHAQAASVPMIFAVNKIDKDGANPQKIYEQLSQMNILVEEWGGKFQSQELSAKKGMNVDLLLEKILLESELLDLKANPHREASGSIVEASLDKGRGYVANVLVENGSLKQGDLIVSGQHYGRIKAMFNERNQRVEIVPPATPVQILGLNGAPQAGEKFKVFADESEAKETATKRAQIMREQGLRARKHITLDEIGRRLALGNFKELNVIIKGDVDGSVEALSDSLQKLSTQEVAVRVVHKAVGQISESDVLLATASDALVIGFNVRPSVQANKLAENEGVQIKTYSIIYNAIEEIRSAMEGMLEPKFQEKIVANVEVREVYKFDKATVAGCYVLDGKISRNSRIRVIREGIVAFPKGEGQSGELGSLKRFKDDMKDVASGYECGLTVKNFSDLKVGDIVEAFEEEEIKRTL